MPTVNIYYTNKKSMRKLSTLAAKLKPFVAKELTCGNISLKPNEVSVRLIPSEGRAMIGDVEIDVTAHAFAERVSKQDKICLNIQKFVKENAPSLGSVYVWLQLCELGHSWKD